MYYNGVALKQGKKYGDRCLSSVGTRSSDKRCDSMRRRQTLWVRRERRRKTWEYDEVEREGTTTSKMELKKEDDIRSAITAMYEWFRNKLT
jgi:hypothetical protein